MSAPLLLVSDVHLTEARPERTERFLRFLQDRVARERADLVIGGDLFDWWYADRTVPSDVAEVIAALEQLPGAVTWIEGNHDLFVGRGLAPSSPIASTAEPISLQREGIELHVAHGDLVDPGERGYRLFRALLRGIPGRAGARIAGPRLTRWVGGLAAMGSRGAQGGVDGYDGASEPRLEAGKRYAAARPEDLTVLGHGHWFGWWPGLICLGDWLRWSSYARIDATGVSLWRYDPGGDRRVMVAPEGAVAFS